MRSQEAIIILEKERQTLSCVNDETGLSEAYDTAIEALQKQIPNTVMPLFETPCIQTHNISQCPTCRTKLSYGRYCFWCGKALEWR